MSRAAMRHLPGLVLVASAIATGPASGQARAGATAVLSADTVPLGHIVELQVTVRAPSGSAIYFPETLPATVFIESHGPVSWKAEPAPGGATLKLTYPLLTLGVGRVPVPGLDVLVGPAGRAAGGAVLPGGSAVGAWKDAPRPDVASNRLASIAPREVRVASLFELEGVLGGVGPMPAADVIGPSWSLASLALLSASALLLVGGLAATLRRRPRFRAVGASATVGSLLENGRLTALRELDDLLALELHAEGRPREFYTRTSGIVRRYVELFDPHWGPSLTSTELMRGLEARASEASLDQLSAEMSDAEAVKFGPPGSETGAAEAHWRIVRRWVETSGRRDP